MKKLLDILKVLTERKLSEKEIKLAEQGLVARGTKQFVSLEKIGDQIKRVSIEYKYATTPDVSHGRNVTHTGHYPAKKDTKYYDKEGILISKEIRNLPHGKKKTIVYNTPGQFFGKKEDRYETLESMTRISDDWYIIHESKKPADILEDVKYCRVSYLSPNSPKPLKEIKFKQ